MDDQEAADLVRRLTAELAAVSLILSELIAEQARKNPTPQRYMKNIETNVASYVASVAAAQDHETNSDLDLARRQVARIFDNARDRLKKR